MPMEVPIAGRSESGTKPIVARGVALKKSEYLAMGPTPGCYSCKAIVKGDVYHKPDSPECRE